MVELDPKIKSILLLSRGLFAIFILLIVFLIFYFLRDEINDVLTTSPEEKSYKQAIARNDSIYNEYLTLWKAKPITSSSENKDLQSLIKYGKQLIQHTSKYLGPNGSVAQISNGMNCQNCHLDGGTRPWGNNYGAVFATYPKYRARSGTKENIYKRINDCFERSLNGQPLSETSKEMIAIKSYIEYIGSNVPKDTVAKGTGIYKVPYLNRAIDPVKGEVVYNKKCMSCHQTDGQGILNSDGTEYVYPPLWGSSSYNQGAGLYRMSRMAGFIKYNMPLGVNYYNPELSDEEAWDLAAYINSQSRPLKDLSKDWPKIKEKPVDHPFGPYVDSFSEKQHKFGPFQPIEKFKKNEK
jgi:thiosulfate dehydrogenase